MFYEICCSTSSMASLMLPSRASEKVLSDFRFQPEPSFSRFASRVVVADSVLFWIQEIRISLALLRRPLMPSWRAWEVWA